MHRDHQVFLDALAAKRRLRVRFFHRKEGREFTRVCAPLDYGPLRGAKEPIPHYQLWDFEKKEKPKNVTLTDAELLEVTPLDETFEPSEIITWKFKPNAWTVPRDWAEFS